MGRSAETGEQPRIATYGDLQAHMDRLGLFHMELGLGRMRSWLAQTGLVRAPFVAAHVVGTNGKGSTAAFLERLAREHGVRTGLYASPHFVTMRERVRISGRMLPESEWAGLAAEALAVPGAETLTYFELLTCLALLAFVRHGVELAVLEAGLGGTHDAVTAVNTDLTLFTPIGLDHMKVLGGTLREIAADKAGAMRHAGVAITGGQPDEAMAELLRTASEREVRLVRAREACRLPEDVRLGLVGHHQADNALLAYCAWRELTGRLGVIRDEGRERDALEAAFLPGRFQFCPAGDSGGPDLILDGAHNVPALLALERALRELGLRPRAVVFSCLADKDGPAMAEVVARLTDGPVLVPAISGCDRSARPQDLARLFPDRGVDFADVDAALRSLSGRNVNPVLVCGSLYLLAALYTTRPTWLEAGSRPVAAPTDFHTTRAAGKHHVE